MFQPQPKWVVIGGCSLAFLSAAVNAGFLIKLGTSVSHLTGDVSKVAVGALSGEMGTDNAVRYLVSATLGFVAGATVAGFFIHHPTLELSRPYGRAVSAIGVCLLASHFTLAWHPVLAVGLASYACGLQNALATHYRGMVLRTTHLTGLLTDLGTNLGMRIKGHHVPGWKIAVPSLLVLSFFAGSVLGALLVLRWELPFALILAAIYLFGGFGWTVFKHLIAPRLGL